MANRDPEGARKRNNPEGFNITNLGAYVARAEAKEKRKSQQDRNGQTNAEEEEQNQNDQATGDGAEQDTQVHCKLSFRKADGIPINLTKWKSQTIHLPLDQPIAEFDKNIKAIIVPNLQQDARLLYNMHDQTRLLLYYFRVPYDICNETRIDPMRTEHKFAIVEDLLLDPSQLTDVDVTISLGWRKRPKSHPNQSKHRYERIRRESDLNADDLVFERTFLNYDTDRATYTYVHLGFVPADEAAPPPREYKHSSNDEICENSGYEAALRDTGIRNRDVLIGYYFDSDPKSEIRIISVRAWDFGTMYIGNCIDDYKQRAFNDRDKFIGHFRVARNIKMLDTFARGHLRIHPGGDNEDQNVPFRPPDTLNTFDPTLYELGDVEDPEYTDVVCTFILHLNLEYEGRDPVQALPWNVQFKFDTRHGAGQIKAHLRKTLLDRSTSEHTPANKKAAMQRLFRGELRNRWRMDLWVLPQGMKKMFRFPTGRADEVDSLVQFLNPDVVSCGKKHALALYVEAHLVLIKKSEGDVGFEPIQEKFPGDDDDEEEDGGVDEEAEDEGQGDLEGGEGDDGEAEPSRMGIEEDGGRKGKQTSRKGKRAVWKRCGR